MAASNELTAMPLFDVEYQNREIVSAAVTREIRPWGGTRCEALRDWRSAPNLPVVPQQL